MLVPVPLSAAAARSSGDGQLTEPSNQETAE
jgi:hypothetical protein